MNRIYRTLWSVATQSWQAVPETAKSAGKKSKSSASGVVASFALSWVLTSAANAQAPPVINQLPTGGTVAKGTATISQTATAQAAAMTVTQTSQRAVVNWNTFNIGSNASVNFVQPNAQAVTLNRVSDANPSQIFGRMTANGQVVLTNANGIYFAPGSLVDVGAITATTHRITDDNFMSGKYVFERNGATGKIINEGNITAALAGYVALLAPEVQNAGVVVARAGTVAMAAGETITLNIDGAGSLAGINTTPSAIATLIENKQAVQAPDGQIILSAVALNKLQAGVIKNSGNLEANSLVSKGGKVYLEGDDITLSSTSKLEAKGATGGGTVLVGGDWQGSGEMRQATKVTMQAGAAIDASATDKGDGGKVVLWSDVHSADSVTRANGSIKAEAGPNGGDGGQIETSGHVLNVDGIQVSTKAAQGHDGIWLLDPYNITISTTLAGTSFVDTNNPGDDTYTAAATSTIKAADINSALANGNVTISTGAVGSAGADVGTITISSAISWATNNTLTLSAASGVSGSSGIGMTGLGRLIVDQAGTTTYSGVISGTGSVTKKGAGTLTLSGANIYSGSTDVNEGTLNAGVASVAGVSGAFGNNSAVTLADVASATLKISAATQIGSLRGGGTTGGGITWSSSSNVLTVGSDNTNTTYSGNLLSAGSLTKVGTGTLNLSGSTTFGQTFTVNNGILQLGSSNIASYASGVATSVIVNNGGTFDMNGFNGPNNGGNGGKLVLNGAGYNNLGALRNSAAGTTSTFIARYWNWGTNPSISATGNLVLGTYYECNGVSAGSCATPTVNISGPGIIDISGITSATFTNSNGAPKYNVISGTLKSNLQGQYNIDLVTLSSGATYNITFGANYTYSKIISGSGGLTLDNTNLAGTNVLTLTGANTYTGPTNINSGYVTTGLATVNGTSGPLGVDSAITIANAANTGLTLNFNTQIGSLSGGGLNGGGVNLNGKTLSVGANNTDSTYSGVISDTNATPVGVLNKIGTGTLILNGSNTYVGLTSINAGALRAASNTALGTNAGGVTVANGATLEIGGPASPSGLAIGAEALTIADGGAIHNVAGYNTYAGAMTFSGNASITIDAGTSLNFTPTGNPGITVAAGKRLSFYTNGDLTFGKALLAGDANSSYLKVGSGTLTIPGSSTLTAAIGVYAGLFDPTGTDYSSEYGSTPDYTVAFYNATSGGARISLTSGTDYIGTATWSGGVPTSTSNASTYSLTYASGLTISNSRYVLIGSTSATSWTVTPKAISVTLTPPSTTYTYNRQLTYETIASGLTAYSTNTSMVNGESIASLNYAVSSSGIAQAGSFTVTPSLNSLSAGAIATNYSFTFNPLTVSVAKAALTVSGTTVANKTYDRSTTASLSNGTLSGVIPGDNVTLTEAGTFASPNVGNGIAVTANDTISGSSASNYTLTQPTGLSADITPKELTVNNTTVANKAYSGTNTATLSGGTLVGVIAGDTVTLTEAGTFASVNASSFPIAVTAADTLGGGSAGNYTLTQPTGLSAYINKANATVTASSATLTYTGLAQTVSGFTSTGLVNGETEAVLTGVTAGATRTNAGTYASTASGTDSNYNLSFVNGTFTINKANLTKVMASKTYDGLSTVSATQVTVIEGVNGETFTASVGTALISDKNVLTANKTLTDLSGLTLVGNSNAALSNNYNLGSNLPAAGANNQVTIEAKPLGLSIPGATRVYDGTTVIAPSGPVTLSGVVVGEQVNLGTGNVTGFVDKNVGTNKTVTYSGLALSGNDAVNYALPLNPTSNANITPASLSISGITAADKTYDAGTTATVNTANVLKTGLIGSDVVNVNVTGSFTDKNVGTAKTVNLSSSYSGADAGNYIVIDQASTTASITPAPLTVTALDASKNFGAANPAFNVAISGYVGGETAATSGVTGAGSATSTATDLTDVGTAPITPTIGTLSATNYAFTTFVDGTLTIKPISAMNNTEVSTLIGAQLANLTSAQVSRFSATQLQVFSPQQLSALSPSQLAGLTNAQLLSLTPVQLAAISPARIASMTPDQLAGLSANQVTGLTVSQLQALSATQFSSFSDAQLQALSASQVTAITTGQLSALTSAQIELLTSNPTATLAFTQILALTPAQIVGVDSVRVANLTAAEIGSLSDAQLQALSVSQIAAIAPDHFSSLSPAQIMALSITQVINLTPEQLRGLSPAQVASISAAELAYFDARQLAAIGINPKVETPAQPEAGTVVTAAPVAPPTPALQTASTVAASSATTPENNKPFEVAIPVMTEVAAPTLVATTTPVPAHAQAPVTKPEAAPALSPRALQGMLFGNNSESSASTGVLPITILNNAQAKPVTAGVAFEQEADTVSLRTTNAPAVPPMSAKLVFSDKLTTFMVAAPNGEMVAFEGSLLNNRMIIVAPSIMAKRLARVEMNLVLAAAVTSLGKTNRVMLAELKGVLLDLR